MKGISGSSGLDRQALVSLLGAASKWGTLGLSDGSGVEVLLLADGKVRASHRFGPETEGSAEMGFRFETHGEADLPQLSSLFGDSTVLTLQALPSFGPALHLPAGLVDLRTFVARAREDRLSGALTQTNLAERAVAVLVDGRIGAAFLERGGRVWERADALRGMYRHSLDASNPAMHFHRLEPGLARSVLGLALERRQGSSDPRAFNGISVGEGGFTFYQEGKARVHVSTKVQGQGGRFGQIESVPDLDLPDDPPGWETRRFALTLRGRDALNPMTELAMEFSDQYGSGGRKVLEAVRHGLTIEETAARLELDLQALKPWLERLEQDGLIRQRA